IDAIKYIDGTEIKDVRMEGDKTVKVGVATDKQPTAVISGEKISFNDISLSVAITDTLKLLELSEGRVDVVLYDGENIIANKSLSIADATSIKFDGLKPATEYTYVIAASYDALDGSGFNTYILASKTFTTLEAVMFENVNVGQEGVSFGLIWDENYSDREIVSIELYQGETKIKDIETTANSIDELLSNNEYTVIVEYKNNGKTDNIYLTFTTVAKAKPKVSVTRSSITQTSVEFGVSFTDIDGVGEITKIELLHKNGNRTAENTAIRSFSGLLSNNTYTVKVTYTYDLNDGKGEQTSAETLELKTAAKTIPTLSITNPSKTQTSVGFGIDYRDPDAVGVINKIELVHARLGTVSADNLNVREFKNLLSNNIYTVNVTYTYNLNDGQGDHIEIKKLDIKTDAKTEPTVTINNPTKTQTSVGFGVDITDIDNICTVTSVELVHATRGTLAAENVSVREFENLLSNNIYTVKVTYTYDLNDGDGVHTKSVTLDIRTEAKLKPVIEIADLDYNIKHIEFNVTETDVDNTGGVTKVELYQGDTLARTSNSLTSALFEELLSDTEYTVKITYEYDLNDGVGKHTETVTQTVKTRYDFGVGDWEPSKGLEITNGVITGIGSCNDMVLFIDKPIESYAFCMNYDIERVYIYGEEGFDIGGDAFGECISLEEVKLAGTMPSILVNAFDGCVSLESIVIPEGVVSLSGGFTRCTALKTVVLPESLKTIDRSVFDGCRSLKSITIPSGVTSIGDYAFRGCTGLTSITIPNGVTSIGNGAFSDCIGLKEITIPNGVTSIGDSAFDYCTYLESIDIPESIISIGEYAFNHCTSLKSINIPDGVTSIGESTFDNCTSLKSIDIPKSVTSIGAFAFADCTSLESVNISEGVTTIGEGVFTKCTSLKTVTIPDGVKFMGGYVFANTNNLTVYVSAGCNTKFWNSTWMGDATVVRLEE
ncbi:MAG: leucine-rich repeat domain-containing protein, partial [Clostridia bacterium]|nr:leucine-rich repeat domain-containing protein [Clostridia bacterium]